MKCLKCDTETGAEWKTLCYTHWRARPIEEVRSQRQAKIDRKVARLLKKSERLEKEGELKASCMDQYSGDISFYTQPATPTSGFGRYRSRLYERKHKGFELLNEAEELKEQAEWLQATGARVKGDAERERQVKRDLADTIYSKGSTVHDFSFGKGIITRVNTKTYTVRFESGGTYTRCKSWFT